MRLVHRGRAHFVDSGHGEVPAPAVDGELGKIREPFLHYPFSHGVSQWVTRHNVYSTREAELELAGPPGWNWRELFCGSRQEKRSTLRNMARNLPARPLLRFFHNYLLELGGPRRPGRACLQPAHGLVRGHDRTKTLGEPTAYRIADAARLATEQQARVCPTRQMSGAKPDVNRCVAGAHFAGSRKRLASPPCGDRLAFVWAAAGVAAGGYLWYARPRPTPPTEIFRGITYTCEELREDECQGPVHLVQVDLTAPGIGLYLTPLDPEAVERGYQYCLAYASSVLSSEGLAVLMDGACFSAD